MTPLQIKTRLWKLGLTISDIAREIEPEYDATFDSLRTMITDLFYHGKWNAKLAGIIETKYQIRIDRPSRPRTVREMLRAA